MQRQYVLLKETELWLLIDAQNCLIICTLKISISTCIYRYVFSKEIRPDMTGLKICWHGRQTSIQANSDEKNIMIK